MKFYAGILLFLLFIFSFLQEINAQKPAPISSIIQFDSLPPSEINIPIQISLLSVYQLAEKSIDTAIASHNWPHSWMMAGCGTRFKFHFRRTPLYITAYGTNFSLFFTGSYQIVSSTRACWNNIVFSPWTPPCHCGFEEGERKVNIGINFNFQLLSNYQIKTTIQRTKPLPLNQCKICFWGEDITYVVMNEVKKGLDASIKTLKDSFSTINIRSYLQPVWQKINKPYYLPGLGWLQVNPTQIRINSLYAKNNMLNVSLGLTTKPVIRMEKPVGHSRPLPNISAIKQEPGFTIFLSGFFHYDSLSTIIYKRLKGKRFYFAQGNNRNYVVINNVQLYRYKNRLKMLVAFGGSYKGTAYLSGTPVYNAKTKSIYFTRLAFDIQSRNILLKMARWLLNETIINELKANATFNLSPYYELLKLQLNKQLNKTWAKGYRTYGNITDVELTSIQPLKNYLMVQSKGTGALFIKITEIAWCRGVRKS